MKNSIIKTFLLIPILGFFLILIYSFRPITTVEDEPTKNVTSDLSNVYVNTRTLDVQITLATSDLQFYINRSAHNQNLIGLLDANLAQPITITFVDRCNLVSRFAKSRHICKIEMDDCVLYSEFKAKK